MSKTVVGLFSSIAEAERVKTALTSEGYSAKVIANDGAETGNSAGTENASSGDSIGQKISNFFHSLTGGDDDVRQHYAAGINSGGALLGITCDDQQAASVAALLRQHGASEIEGAKTADSTLGRDVSEATGQTAIPIVEEELLVGKREVERGGVRVYSHVVEKPVSADVTLRNEQIVVERRPVDRAATAADFQTGQDSVIELNAMGEEAVVGKTARVVEEVLLGKTSTSHTEVIQDTVSKTEVDIEEIPTASTTRTNL